MAIVTCAIIAATAWVARKGLPGRRPASNPKKQTGVVRGLSGDARFILPLPRAVGSPWQTSPRMDTRETDCYRNSYMATPLLRIDGEVENRASLSFADLAAMPAAFQVGDVGRLDPKRKGDAVTLEGLLARVRPKPSAHYLTLHSSSDDFHASIPLESVRNRAIVIYRLDGGPLPAAAGGPVRFFIPDFTACHTTEVDECANVKFVDRIELSANRGQDNRPHDEKEHAELHERETG